MWLIPRSYFSVLHHPLVDSVFLVPPDGSFEDVPGLRMLFFIGDETVMGEAFVRGAERNDAVGIVRVVECEAVEVVEDAVFFGAVRIGAM